MLAVASIVGTLVMLGLLLLLTDIAERRVVAEPVLIARVVRARKLSPEYVEAFVATRAEKVLRQQQ